jgi:transposase-like protein
MGKTTKDDTIKRAVLKLLARGQVTLAEAARLADVSRQLVAHWARDMPDNRPDYLARLWLKANRRLRP